ncbi:MAG: four helix bundle protein [Acidobacteria bacterium]|nr:four helix bundle protein [Acidobacteriota bacterium]
MGVRSYRDLIAWQLADEFKQEVINIVLASQAARQDVHYRTQLFNAATAVSKDVVEGFLRYSPAEFSRFLDYAIGSLGEAEGRLVDGIDLRFFDRQTCLPALRLARRCLVALVRLKQSQRQATHPKPRPTRTRDAPSNT